MHVHRAEQTVTRTLYDATPRSLVVYTRRFQ